ncbi:MAG TPA: hypothetical protein VMT42_03150 [candidate division Zixibacteria bacterium]|nr:hypothetical protein [candidate division Zixibacteria bacterium]
MDATSFLDMAFLLVATVLTLLSVHSLRLLARIRLEKSLFIPVMMSAVFFWCGSFVNVVYNLSLQNVSNLTVFQEPISVLYRTMLLIGISILTYGVFSYWRITRNVKLPKLERSKKREDQQEVTVENPETIQQVTQSGA